MKKIMSFIFAILLSAPIFAQSDSKWPSSPIKILIPFSPGALTDIVARMYGVELSKRLNVSVVVENKPGAGGIIAAQNLISSPADGHTMMLVSSGHAANPALKANLPFDTLRDMSGVVLVASSPTVVIVGANSPYKTLSDLIVAAKKQPNFINFGSAGVGSGTHLGGEYVSLETGIKMTHIPYKGVQEAVTEVIAGRLDVAFPPIALALPFIKDGRIRALALTGNKRSDLLPNVPTVAELGYRDFDYRLWYAFISKSGTQAPILARLSNEIKAVTDLPEIQEKMKMQGLEPAHIQLADFDKYIASEIVKLGRIVKASGIKPD
jgi:tripartite-type tricarboxylate transporter receptor subunit TctC